MTIAAQTEGILELQLKALADPTRRRIIELLKRRGCCSCDEVSAQDSGLCICDLESALSLSQPTITHHIQVLREAGLVKTRKLGRWVYCFRDEEGLDELAEGMKKL